MKIKPDDTLSLCLLLCTHLREEHRPRQKPESHSTLQAPIPPESVIHKPNPLFLPLFQPLPSPAFTTAAAS